ncbi:trafficking protein particle complex subunit 9 [Anaeramoeba ignava]|uniref:Trafficking protein particle complex subunit 9 n=1 Tax=Anaeramoeba ignava TaxID=1746090 RepID=A0A9Q0R4F1_ANAIG|nr:trafficking protein particle complex subunit 9 [Anaeramoeba ignava]
MNHFAIRTTLKFDPFQEILDSGKIRALVAPIGEISEQTFNYYFNLIQSVRKIPFESLTPSLIIDPHKTNNHVSHGWKEGNVFFEFFDHYYEKSMWEGFQPYKKIFAFIGVVHCQKAKNFEDLNNQFKKLQEEYKSKPFIARCFAFDPRENQDDPMLDNFYMIPNTENQQHLCFYLNTLMTDMANSILNQFNTMMIDYHQIFGTPSTPDEYQKTIDPHNLRKLKKSRQLKLLGDYCLLSGSSLDAKNIYLSALEQSKLLNDFVWIAGCLEGFCCSIILENYHKPMFIKDEKIVDEISHNLTDSINFYSKKKLIPLQVEAIFKLSRFLVNVSSNSNRKIQILQLLSDAYSFIGEFTPKEKILFTTSLSSIYEQIGCWRKFGFSLYETGLYYRTLRNWKLSLHFFLLSAPFLQLPSLLQIGSKAQEKYLQMLNSGIEYSESVDEKRKYLTKSIFENSRHKITKMIKMQMNLISDLIENSNLLKDSDKIVQYSIFDLKTFYQYLDSNMQKQIVFNLMSSAKSTSQNSLFDLRDFPPIISVKIDALSEYLKPREKINKEEPEKKLFLFNPFENKNKKEDSEIFWVQNEMGKVSVVISNPFDFELIIHSASLETSGVGFDSFPISLAVAPRTFNKEIFLHGKPNEPGELSICGLNLNIFNIGYYHKIEPIQKIRVVPPLPLLFVEGNFSQKIQLCSGETRDFTLNFQNSGAIPIDKLNINFTEKLKQGITPNDDPFIKYYSFPLFSWDKNIILKNLPLAPSCSFCLPIRLVAKSGIVKSKIEIDYEANSEKQISETIHLIPNSENQTKQNDQEIQPKNDVSYYRKFHIQFDFNIIDQVSITRFDLVPMIQFIETDYKTISKSILCYLLLFELKNSSQQTFHIFWDKNLEQIEQQFHPQNPITVSPFEPKPSNAFGAKNQAFPLVLEPNSEKRVIFFSTTLAQEMLRKVNYSERNIESFVPYEEVVNNFVFNNHRQPDKNEDKFLQNLCNFKSAVIENISFHWISNLETHGILTGSHLSFTKSSVDLVFSNSNFFLDFIIENQPKISQVFPIQISLINRVDFPIFLDFSLKFYFDDFPIENQKNCFLLKSGIIDQKNIKIEGNANNLLKIHLFFLKSGTYQIKATCKINQFDHLVEKSLIIRV